MRCADILHVIEEHYPLSYALDWDNCDCMTGRFDMMCKRDLHCTGMPVMW